MVLHIELKVKFRAFFVDLAKFEEVWNFPIAGLPPTLPHELLKFDRNGVKLNVSLKALS